MDTSLNLTAPAGVASPPPSEAARAPDRPAAAALARETEPSATVNISAAARAAAQAEASHRPDPAIAREPDAPTAASHPAVQRYLENAARPDNQPPPSPFRDTA